MLFRFHSIAATASLAFVLLTQGNASAGFLVESGSRVNEDRVNGFRAEQENAWLAIGEGAGAGSGSSIADEHDENDLSLARGWISRFLTQSAAHFGRLGCSAPGGMTSSNGDTGGQANPVYVLTSLMRPAGAQISMWLQIEGAPRRPPPLGSSILQPPRA